MTTSTTSAGPSLPFELSAQFYDAIHADKDYAREVDLVRHHLKLASDMAVVDYGCGTGQFMSRLANHCRHITGVDPSSPMLEIARKRMADRQNVTFDLATITNHRDRSAGRVWYDAACCMFGAMSYATAAGPLELTKNLRAIRDLMVPGGRLVFDVLHYAACVTSLNLASVKSVSLGDGSVLTRNMRKRFNASNAIASVDINFDIFTLGGPNRIWDERHSIRAFTQPEIVAAADASGWKCLAVFPGPQRVNEEESCQVSAADYYIWSVLEAT